MIDLKKKSMDILAPGEKHKRKIRFLSDKHTSSLTYVLYENKAFFISSKRENFAFLIESKEFVEMMTMQFEILWGTAKELKK